MCSTRGNVRNKHTKNWKRIIVISMDCKITVCIETCIHVYIFPGVYTLGTYQLQTKTRKK